MKQIQGTSYNIEDDIVGRITFGKNNLFGRSNDILVCKDASKPSIGYLATITETTSFVSKGKPYCVVENVGTFQKEMWLLSTSKEKLYSCMKYSLITML